MGPADARRPSRWTLLWRWPHTYPEVLMVGVLMAGVFVVLGLGTGRGISWYWTVVFPSIWVAGALVRLNRLRRHPFRIGGGEATPLLRDEMPDLEAVNQRLEDRYGRDHRDNPE